METMKRVEFNLSVLENVEDFTSPPDNSANYETMLNLIKEEIDIETEDERESQRGGKTPMRWMKQNSPRELEFCDGSSIQFKSPRPNNCSIKVKSPRSLMNKREARKWRKNHLKMNSEANYPRARSLGYVKPGRSFRAHGIHRVSVSHWSDTSARSESGDSGVLARQNVTRIFDNSTETESEAELILGIEEPSRMDILDKNVTSSGENKSAPVENDEPPIAKVPDDDYVESSQSTASSDLRKKLNSYRNKRLPTGSVTEKIRDIESTESEEDLRNFSLKLSPDSRSSAVDRVTRSVTPMARKRKADAVGPLMVSTPKQKKLKSTLNEKSLMSPIVENKQVDCASSLNGLSQDMEDCLINSDYEQMNDLIDTDMLDRTSFTFETIELLNEYESANQSSNNRILSKILASPKPQKKDESPVSFKSPAGAIQPTEDPLFIEENQQNTVSARSMRKNRNICEEAEKKKSLNLQKCSNRTSRMKKDKTSEELTSTTSKRKNVQTATALESARKSSVTKKLEISAPCSSHMSDIEGAIESDNSKRLARENSPEDAKEESLAEMDEPEVNGERRRSARLREKKSATVAFDLNDDKELMDEADALRKQVAEERLAFSDEILARVKELVVRLRQEPLPQHKNECQGRICWFDHDERKKFIKFAPLNKSYYNHEEDYVIRKNWKDFCKDHNWNTRDYGPFLHLKLRNKLLMSSFEETRKFVQYLANGLPNRPLSSVYRRFRIIYGPNNSEMRYTEEDDKKLLAYMRHGSEKNSNVTYTDLARVLNKSCSSISHRIKILSSRYARTKNKRASTKVQWDLSLAEEFVRTLTDVTLSDELIELKDAFIPKVVWEKMQEKMDIDYRVLKRFWDYQLHLQLFSPKPIYLNRIKILLIKLIYGKNISHHRDIKWPEVAKYFDGATISFLRRIFNHMVWDISRKHIRTRTFKNCIEWLYTVKMEQFRCAAQDKILPRIMYKDRRVEILPQDLEIMKFNCHDFETD